MAFQGLLAGADSKVESLIEETPAMEDPELREKLKKYFAIETNIFYNFGKYIWQFKQIIWQYG